MTPEYHFTYAAPEGPDLQQGDFISRTARINEIINTYHPYYSRHDYIGFLVLTQSCDLVHSRVKSEYLTLCAVRPLRSAIDAEIAKHQQNPYLKHSNSVYQYGAQRISGFVESLLNNNNEDYFYLHSEFGLGISSSACAFTRLSIAIQATHYDACISARKASLTPEFQAKLGWHVGKIYNRVGTKDWVPDSANESEWRAMISRIVSEHVNIIDEEKVKVAKKQIPESDLPSLTREELLERIRAITVPSRKTRVLDAVMDALQSAGFVSGKDALKVRRSLDMDAVIKGLLK